MQIKMQDNFNKAKVIVICGPTASGKTALSIEVAKKINGEIISCDSMQIYKDMNIGTAKPTKEEMGKIKHYLIDYVLPTERYSVAEYKKDAKKAIKEVIEKGKTPIIVGGTGLYVDSLIYEIEYPEIKFDEEYRKKLEKEVEEVSFDFQADSEVITNDEVPKEEYRIKKMHPLGIIHKTFIVAENEEGMYLIDQHAIAERINYEKFMKELSKENKDTTDLLVPIKLEYPKDEFLKIKEYLDVLKSIGVYLEEFGDHTFLVRRHPTFIYKGREKDSIEKIISILLEKGTFSKEKFIEKTATTLACRLSIKANDYISLEEADYLLETIRTCENPFTCPHGRPTIIAYSNYELEKMFKRVMN